jgi:VWFA-related protein
LISRRHDYFQPLHAGLCLAFVLLAAPLAARQHALAKRAAPSPSGPRVLISRPADPPMTVCVVVRNPGGQTVSYLRQKDFRLYDNNRWQRIADFGANLVPVLPEHSDAPGTVRYTALFFDDLHYDFTETIRVTDSAYITFGPELSRWHQFGVYTASGDLTLDFTGDREKFHQALLTIRPHLAPSLDARACPPITDYQAYLLLYLHDPLALKIAFYDMERCSDPIPPHPSFAEMKRMKAVVDAEAGRLIAQDNGRSGHTLDALEKLIDRVAALPDPRNIIIASPGFLTGMLSRRVDELARRAAKQHIIINTLNTAGLVRQIPYPPARDHSRQTAELTAIIAAKNEMRTDRSAAVSDPLSDLATMTGGNFVTNMDDLDEGFKEAGPLPRAYYVLGYFPNNLRHDGNFHALRVTVVRRESLGVQAPDGYFAPGAPPQIAASSIRDRHLKRKRVRRR